MRRKRERKRERGCGPSWTGQVNSGGRKEETKRKKEREKESSEEEEEEGRWNERGYETKSD